MSLESILRRQFDEDDRKLVQEQVIRAVIQNPERFIKAYNAYPYSFGGRYICADMFKEMFEQYSASKETRNRYNTPVHNAAAVLAAEQFRRIVSASDSPEKDTVVFLTGIPGAGKTSTVLEAHGLAHVHKAIFEGQLVKPEHSIPKIQQVLDQGLKPAIVVVHAMPEDALNNTFRRFDEVGRGASIDIMAMIQGGLPEGLKAINETFGKSVELDIRDVRDRNNPANLTGWEYLQTLSSEGNYEHVRHRLAAHLEQTRQAGLITEACYRQSAGLNPQRMVKQGLERGYENAPGRQLQEKSVQRFSIKTPDKGRKL